MSQTDRSARRTTLLAIFGWFLFAAETRAEQAAIEPAEAVVAKIDAAFERNWQLNRVTPAAAADDATFLRRVTLDLTGLIPTVGEVRTFLADTRSNKRQRVIAELLERPQHASHLARLWRGVLIPKTADGPAVLAFESWLQMRFLQNVPYDRVVREILMARGTLLQSEPTIFFAANNTKPEELAASSSRAFLGLQVSCAQCHDHPFAPWKQADFWSFAAFYARVQGPATLGDQTPVEDGPDGEVRHPKTLKAMAPRFLDGPEVSDANGEARRAKLARWVTAPENPFFARATVNRVWWLLFGRGLVQPVDDFGPHTSAAHPEVLDVLAADFIASGFDLRRTLRTIAASRPYQLASDSDQVDREFLTTYTAMPVRSLSARQIFDALLQASGQRESKANTPAERQTFLAQFEAPTRDPLEFQGGILQILTLINGPLVARLTNPTSGDLIAALADSPFLTDQQRVETLFLATVSRWPREIELAELQKAMQTQHTAEARTQALGHILWALLNSTEFVLNR
jgi:hypothetical protein